MMRIYGLSLAEVRAAIATADYYKPDWLDEFRRRNKPRCNDCDCCTAETILGICHECSDNRVPNCLWRKCPDLYGASLTEQMINNAIERLNPKHGIMSEFPPCEHGLAYGMCSENQCRKE